jgi:Flp pilus assembly protein TadD
VSKQAPEEGAATVGQDNLDETEPEPEADASPDKDVAFDELLRAPEGSSGDEHDADAGEWGREGEGEGEDQEQDHAAGVPRTISPAAKRIVAAAVAAAALLLVAGGLRSWKARQERLADDSSAHARAPSAAGAKAVSTAALPSPSEVAAAEPSQAAAPPAPEETTASAESVPSAPAAAEVVANAESPSRLPSPSQPLQPSSPAAAPPDPSAKPATEMALDMRPMAAGSTLVAQASRALETGQTAKALDLARQAVDKNPGNAEAWLTLGAAYQASGNGTAAREAYRNCVAQAKTAGVTECRVLSEK